MIALATVPAMLVAGRAAADSGPAPIPFAAIVARSTVIAVVTVTRLDDTGTGLRVDEVLKGEVPATLSFAANGPDVPLRLGEVALVSFVGDTLDFRAPTVAWEISPDGAIDRAGLQRAPGLPPTVDALRAWFARPAASGAEAVPSGAPLGSSGSGPAGFDLLVALAIVVAIAALVGLAVLVSRAARRGASTG